MTDPPAQSRAVIAGLRMTNLEYQEKLLDLITDGHTVLSETERFANQLRLRARGRYRRQGAPGWDGVAVGTFNAWAMDCWEDSWPNEWPASDFTRWRLIREILRHNPPPEPLLPDLPLVVAVDESFAGCLRYGIDPGEGDPANRLVEWRRGVWKEYRDALRALLLFHPASLPERLGSFLSLNPDAVPSKTVIAGFEFAGYWEKKLFSRLADTHGALALPLPQVKAKPRAVVYADREQEVFGLLGDLIRGAGEGRLHELAVVLLDRGTYAPILSQHLKDLLGAQLEGENAAYNLLAGDVLTSQSLWRAALLPLDFCLGGESGTQLFSLLRSPYYGYFGARGRALAQWDRVWREQGIEKGLTALLGSLGGREDVLPRRGAELTEGLGALTDRGTRAASEWSAGLRSFWKQMEFPVIANERDRIAWQRLTGLLDGFDAELGDSSMRAAEFAAWLTAAGEKAPVQPSGFEDAGIQVIGELELRGLAFKRLFVPGFLSGVIPQPARSLPFLSVRERRLVLGGTAESQFEFAAHLFGQVQAAARETVVSRPLLGEGGEPCLPSPFWPASEETMAPVIPWRHDLPVMQRARWVRDGIEGIAAAMERKEPAGKTHAGGESAPDLYRAERLRFPSEVSVSELELLLACAGRFFLRVILGLEALPVPTRGLDAAVRGRKIHALLAGFGRRLRGIPGGHEREPEALCRLLDEMVRKDIEEQARVAHWRVELARLLGGAEGAPGLLKEWLALECSRFGEGWRWTAFEPSFDNLKLRDCPVGIKGRLDRLDLHSELGCICWDYKTGAAPGMKEVLEDFKAPQLPVYLLAVRKGLVPAIGDRRVTLAAGYIALQSVRKLNHCLVIGADERMESFLSQWESVLAEKIDAARRGQLAPLWVLQPCEERCDYECLCGELLFAGPEAASGCAAPGNPVERGRG